LVLEWPTLSRSDSILKAQQARTGWWRPSGSGILKACCCGELCNCPSPDSVMAADLVHSQYGFEEAQDRLCVGAVTD